MWCVCVVCVCGVCVVCVCVCARAHTHFYFPYSLHTLLAVDAHKSVPVHPMEAMEAPHIRTFGTGWVEGSASRSGRFTCKERPKYRLNWRMCGIQKLFGCFAEEGTLMPLPAGIRTMIPQTPCPWPSYITDCAVRVDTNLKFKVCKSVHHHTIQINHQLDATISQVYYLMFMYSSTCFRHPHAHHQELNNCSSSLWFYCWSRGDSSAVGHGRAWPDHDQQHCYRHALKVKSEAATAVVELLMMGVRTPETCWAVNKHQILEKLLHLVGDLFE